MAHGTLGDEWISREIGKAQRMTSAQDRQQAIAVQMIQDAIRTLPASEACGALTSALIMHPDMTPKMLHGAGNLLSRAADEAERDQ